MAAAGNLYVWSTSTAVSTPKAARDVDRRTIDRVSVLATPGCRASPTIGSPVVLMGAGGSYALGLLNLDKASLLLVSKISLAVLYYGRMRLIRERRPTRMKRSCPAWNVFDIEGYRNPFRHSAGANETRRRRNSSTQKDHGARYFGRRPGGTAEQQDRVDGKNVSVELIVRGHDDQGMIEDHGRRLAKHAAENQRCIFVESTRL